jgi:hypothetical protein
MISFTLAWDNHRNDATRISVILVHARVFFLTYNKYTPCPFPYNTLQTLSFCIAIVYVLFHLKHFLLYISTIDSVG